MADVGAAAPLLVLGLLGVLALILRWAFRRGTSLVRTTGGPGPQTDYGLLVPLGEPATRGEGEQLTAVLRTEGVRAFLIHTTDGLRIMVFEPDMERALDTIMPMPDDGPDDSPYDAR